MAYSRLLFVAAGLAGCLSLRLVVFGAPETVGERPYELDWANRLQDDHPPLVDFEDLQAWRVECQDAVASFARTREQQIWGQHVGKLVYRGTGPRPQIRIVPPKPAAIANAFDAVTLWCYGNNWGWAPDASTPQVSLGALFEDAAGREFGIQFQSVNWKEWHLVHRRLAPDQIERVRTGARFKGLLITNANNQEDRTLYFDNLAVFVEQFPPLRFEPRPQRGIAMLPGQPSGANTGPGRLPFPTRDETILPANLVKDFKTSLTQEGNAWVFTYSGSDGELRYRYAPGTGAWSDIAAVWSGPGQTAKTIRPCVDGGIYLATPRGPARPEKAEHLSTTRKDDLLVSCWRISAGDVSATITYRFQLWNKSLVIDVLAPGGVVQEVRFGRATGLENPRLVTNPFYPAQDGRPAVAVSGTADEPLFVTGNTDWYLSNGSILWARNAVEDDGVTYNGGTRYLAKTDGQRNSCFERFFVTVTPRYEETLPTIANPQSPWKHTTGTRVWRAHGASNRENDAKHWANVHRHGMTQLVVTDHETGWRDGGESFTFRTRAAPGKGGDQGQYDYARLMQDQLGFIYGPYNNFTDFAPVNEHWSFDLISRTTDNQLQRAWMRCYAPKPARAVEFCARLAPIIEDKFKFSTAYCDVHTAVAPWHRVDYDARVPGAGTFAAVFYSFGEIMLLQKQAWGGPVYSEGNYHCFYTGLTDGNYGQDQSYRPADNPWLVDFDLRQMHDLGCNFGMGNLDMFYSSVPQPRRTPAERDAWLDRFLAATVAFGHPGFLAMEAGLEGGLRSYYMLQQLHSRYCLANAVEIRYANEPGELLDTTKAVASGAYRLSQVVTRYDDGTVTAVNGNRSRRLVTTAHARKIDLPPNGYCGWTTDGAVEVWSGDQDGHRADYAAAPDYFYVDGRGKFSRFARAAGDGMGICRILPDGKFEVIPMGDAEVGFAIEATDAVALDKERKELGPATLRTARGLTYVRPVKGAFSYRLQGAQKSPATRLNCRRDQVVPGETVAVHGREAHTVRVPFDAKSGQRLWHRFEDEWIDFTVIEAMDASLDLDGDRLRVNFTSHLPERQKISVGLRGKTQLADANPGAAARVEFDLGRPQAESAEILVVELRAGETTNRIEAAMLVNRQFKSLVTLPKWQGGICLRGGEEKPDFGESGGIAHLRQTSCGGVEHSALFMHPPYQGGVGYAFARYDPVPLPVDVPVAFRALVGKGDGSDLGDGILYRLMVTEEGGREILVTERTVTNHVWMPIEGDLSRWRGQRIQLKLVTDVGTKNNSSGDWGCWAGMRIESKEQVLARELVMDARPYRREPGPYPVQGLRLEDIRKAKTGWLRFDGKGLEGGGEYRTFGVLNGIDLGDMPGSHGAEGTGTFTQRTGLKLSAAALQSLGLRNWFTLKNPNRDSFSVRRFWLELELADGQKGSSDISTPTWSQPAEWKYAEGIGVPFGQNIEVEIWMPNK